MLELIEALQIFAKYSSTKWPTVCTHDQLTIMEVDRDDPTEDERGRLEELGFLWSPEDDVWISFRFGSA